MSNFFAKKSIFKRGLYVLLTIFLIFSFTSCSSAATNDKPQLEDVNLLMSTTTSVNDTGLLEYLAPILEEDTGIVLEWVSQGTGQAIQTAKDGNADLILVHAKTDEEAFVAEGYGLERIEIMYNYFVFVGPKADPAGIMDSGLTASEALAKISEASAKFVSRGDDSGTHKKELKLWTAANIAPSGDWYVSAGKGMGDVLTMASELQAYTLTDKATYLSMKDQLDLEIVVDATDDLLNQYTVIQVDPEKYSETNTEASDAFVKWLTSDKVLALIGEYGKDKYGEALFTINFGK
ncbi:MAG: solute-binding protein [Eubacteriaceae bacterium]|nr:solute-binding protein [Eubacteriaceae bacterium]